MYGIDTAIFFPLFVETHIVKSAAKLMPNRLLPTVQQAYVGLMIDIIGRGLVSASHVDDEIRQEIAGFPVGLTFQMVVLPKGPGFIAEVQADGTLKRLTDFVGKPDLSIKFKHMTLAFLVFSFQESTAQAFANDRMIADGEVAYAIRLVRCLDKMEALILPKLVAGLAVKRYPTNLALGEKIQKAALIYGKVAQSFIQRS